MKKDKALEEIFHNFTIAIKLYFNFELRTFQKRIAREIIKRVLAKKRHTIVISICRQAGKTEIIALVLWFLSFVFPKYFGEEFKCGIVAPKKDTSSLMFSKLKDYYEDYEKICSMKLIRKSSERTVELGNNSYIRAFGLFKMAKEREGQKANEEGQTFNLLARDESHDGDDGIYGDQLTPALLSTGGVDIFVGNGGWGRCAYYELIKSQKSNVTVFKYTFDDLKEEFKNDPKGAIWVESMEHYIENKPDEQIIGKNCYCKWYLTHGNFIDEAQLHSLRRLEEPLVWQSNTIDVGIDFGKTSDKTVVTLTDQHRNVRHWGVFKGDYLLQAEEVGIWLEEIKNSDPKNPLHYRRGYCDATGEGDTAMSLYQQEVSFPLYPVVFGVVTKDQLAKRALIAIKHKNPLYRATYDHNHPHAKLFESETLKLLKLHRRECDMIYCEHPSGEGEHDDFPDSWFLSLFGMCEIDPEASNKGSISLSTTKRENSY